jgi:O-antigen/teichoic acid export membrane protein
MGVVGIQDPDVDRLPRSRRAVLGSYRSILRQGAWVASGQAGLAVATLVGNRLITQFVAPELYGLVNLAQNSLVLLRSLTCSPIINAALRYFPEAERDDCVPAFRALISGIMARLIAVMTALTVIGGGIWAFRARLGPSIVATLVIYVVADALRTFEMSLFNAAGRQRPAAFITVLEAALRPLLVVIAVGVLGATATNVFAAITLSVVVALFALRLMTRPEGLSGGGSPASAELSHELWAYALPLIPIAAFNWITSVSDRFLIVWLSRDLDSVGVYAAGYAVVSQLFLMIHGLVALTLRPSYFGAVARADTPGARRTFRLWLATSSALCTLAAVLVSFGGNVLVAALLGESYRRAAGMVPWIAIGYLLFVIEQVQEQKLLAYKRTKAVLFAQGLGALTSIVATIPLVIRYGGVGAAYACPLYFGIQCVAATLLAHRARTEEDA